MAMAAIKAYYDGKAFVPLDSTKFTFRQPALIVVEQETVDDKKEISNFVEKKADDVPKTFSRFEKYFGMIPADFDIEKAKDEYFEEKYGRFH